MKQRAPISKPDYVLNVGDNFYWGGLAAKCGAPAYTHISTGQWESAFENIYTGPGLDGKQWLGVLGNHDFGGYMFNRAWDQVIAYTWHMPEGVGRVARWMTPALYWSTTAYYPDFSVDYIFVDTNAFNAYEIHTDQGHNICSFDHNKNATCGAEGPMSVYDCPGWFGKLWDAQFVWMEKVLEKSSADWQILVTHFPPTNWGQLTWPYLAKKHGIDLMISGHTHLQRVGAPGDAGNALSPSAWIISGGGGGITSEGLPSADGNDDMYGFIDLTLTREEITIEAISHGGQIRSTTKVHPRAPADVAPPPMPVHQEDLKRTGKDMAGKRHAPSTQPPVSLRTAPGSMDEQKLKFV